MPTSPAFPDPTPHTERRKLSVPRVILAHMGYEAVRRHSRRGKIGGSYVRAHGRVTDRPAPRRGRYTSMYVHGYRSASPIAILWGLGAIILGVVLVLAALTVTHLGPDHPTQPATVPSTFLSAQPPAPSQPCYPFQASC